MIDKWVILMWVAILLLIALMGLPPGGILRELLF